MEAERTSKSVSSNSKLSEEMILIVFFQIFLLVSLSFAFSYIFHSYNEFNSLNIQEESKFIEKTREIIFELLGSNMVSAQEALWTCPKNNEGSFCQEYIASECEANCDGSYSPCLPTRAEETSTCRTGTCVNSDGLSCSPNTPVLACEDIGGVWDERAPGEIAQCQRGCCFLGSNSEFVTEAQCGASVDAIGADLDGIVNRFDSTITSELTCLILSNPLAEGACVYSEEVEPGAFDCDFTRKENCLSSGGEFFEDRLCSNSELSTVCIKQDSTSCIDGRDEVYWLDSCGNRENIYEGGSGSARERSWNNGTILPKGESCVLGDSDDPVENQRSCGNCNYIGGSVCGTPSSNDQSAFDGDFVCKDLSCKYTDQWGSTKIRKHGESWCTYDSKIGTEKDGNDRRGIDVPGSSHYRNTCLEGEVREESCLSGRREICVEENDEDIGFSSAACRLNQWALCYDMNQNEEDRERCEEVTDCVLKTVDLTRKSEDNFKFTLCVPKYPPGFELRPDVDVFGEISGQVKSDSEIACGLASVQCKRVKIKGGFFGSTKVFNDRCDDAEFTETMNNLCMSLGDCGASVNILGEYTDDGYNVVNAPELENSYISALRRLVRPVKGQTAELLSEDEIAALYGIDTGAVDYEFDTNALTLIGTIGGASGIFLAYAVSSGAVLSSYTFISTFLVKIGVQSYSPIGIPTVLNGAAGAAAGALIGAATVSLLLQYTGVGASLSKTLQHALIIGGAIAGGIIGFDIAVGFAVGSGVPVVGWILVGFVVGIIAIGWLLGWGKKSEKTIIFDCKPWQAPVGGANCGECGSDGLPCNEYKCQSLGQTCELLNLGTKEEICTDVSPDDASAPAISSDRDHLQEGFDYAQESNLGFNVIGPTSDGCLPVYTPVIFGVELNEPGQCKFDIVPGSDFESMETFFGNSNLYRANHAMTINMPSLAALQGESVDPDVRADFNLYLKCQDRSGNSNSADYAISFCVSPEDDLTAPIMSRFLPQSDSFVAFDATEQTINFYVNEPADCKWDVQDVDFKVMLNYADCVQDVESISLYGFACTTELPITEDENKFYFRCEDQPWLENDNPDGLIRNANTQSTEYILKKSLSELSIIGITPKDETIIGGNVEFMGIDLIVRTEGGAEGAFRTCDFDFGNTGNFVQFFETGTDTHVQPLNLYFENYDIAIRCEDEAGNTAEGSTQFSVDLDSDGPIITRFYNLNNVLHIITDEPSECAYSFDSCGFNFANGTIMSGADLIHTTSFDTSLTHFVKCQDQYENPSSCVAISGGLF